MTEHLFQILRLYKDSVISKEKLKEVISFLVPVKTFEELRLPLKVGATDLNTGDSIIYDSGDLISAIVQSCSIPGVIEPTVLNNKILVEELKDNFNIFDPFKTASYDNASDED